MVVTFRNFNSRDANHVHEVAMKSWKFTYNDIYSEEEIKKFVNEWYNPALLIQLEPKIIQGKSFFKIATNGKELIGFAQIGPSNDSMCLFRIYLDPNYIGKGIGSQLLSMGEKFVKRKGYDSYYCYVHKENDLAINFYENKGFERVNEKNTEDEYYMIKYLD